MDWGTLVALAAVAVAAGFVDAIAGGGGLLTVPALATAGLDPLAVLATNKLQSVFGSGSATAAFHRAGYVTLRRDWPLAAGAGLGAVAGVATLLLAPPDALRKALPVMLALAALYFAFAPPPKPGDRARLSQRAAAFTFVPLVGFYDGLFGPGAGSFYMIGFLGLCEFPVRLAAGRTKLANFASNLASLGLWLASGHAAIVAGLAMGIGQVAGAQAGARVAIRGGERVIRPAMALLCLVLAAGMAKREGMLPAVLARLVP